MNNEEAKVVGITEEEFTDKYKSIHIDKVLSKMNLDLNDKNDCVVLLFEEKFRRYITELKYYTCDYFDTGIIPTKQDLDIINAKLDAIGIELNKTSNSRSNLLEASIINKIDSLVKNMVDIKYLTFVISTEEFQFIDKLRNICKSDSDHLAKKLDIILENLFNAENIKF